MEAKTQRLNATLTWMAVAQRRMDHSENALTNATIVRS